MTTTGPQNFQGTLVEGAVIVDKLTERQYQRPKISCKGVDLENVFKFNIWERYLQRTTNNDMASKPESRRPRYDAGTSSMTKT